MRLFASLLCVIVSAIALADTYPLPSVPDTIREPGRRAAYVLLHFWDAAGLEESVKDGFETDKPRFEQSFVDFLSIFPIASDSARVSAVAHAMSVCGNNPEVSGFMMECAEKYLYGVDSPLKNEEYYVLFLHQALDSAPGDAAGARWEYQLESIMKNRPGTPAADFTYIDRNGRQTSLYDTESDCDILLAFYDPDCSHCSKVFEALSNNPDFINKLNNGELVMLAVYLGENRALWDATKNSLPENWIVGYNDGSIEDDELFFIRNYPSLYLLSPEKFVKIKDRNPFD